MINLLPYRQKNMIGRIRIMRIVNTTMGSIVVLAAIGAILYVPSLVTINSRYALAQAEIARLETEGVLTNTSDIAAYSARVDALAAKLAAPLVLPPTARINSIRSAAQTGISLSGFAMDTAAKPVIIVSGTASTREVLQHFVEVLQRDTTVQSVDSPITNYVKSTNASFTITITFKS